MTVLNFILQEESVLLVTDTLVSNGKTWEPNLFTTKVFAVPHWDGLICGTGVMSFLTAWYNYVNTTVLATDLRHLNEHVPEALRTLYANSPDILHQDYTSTVYHFGFDPYSNNFCGFAYRSTNNFESEVLPFGIGLKPAPKGEPIEINQFPADLIHQAIVQKHEDENDDCNQRVGIGGELISYSLQKVNTDSGYQIMTQITKCHRFDDADTAYSIAVDNLHGSD